MTKTVILPYDPNWEALAWAKENCKSYITNAVAPAVRGYAQLEYPSRNFRIEYFFGNEREALMFMLRWS